MSDEPDELTPEQIAAIHQAAASLSDDDFALTHEERAAVGRAWREHVGSRAHGGKMPKLKAPYVDRLPPSTSLLDGMADGSRAHRAALCVSNALRGPRCPTS